MDKDGREAGKERERAEKKKISSVCVLLFFAVLFLYGCFAFNDYGISVDEDVERNTSLVTYKHLVPSVSDLVTDSVNFPEIEALDSYIDRYYGVAVQLPTVAAEHLFGFRLPLRTVYLIRHFYTFLLFYGAAAVFYFLGKRLTGSRWAALFGVAMLVLSPRMLAESFYNIKDIIFLSFVIYNLYAGVCFLDKPALKNGILLAVVSALCINVRVVGAVVLASCLAVGFVKEITRLYAGLKDAKKTADPVEAAALKQTKCPKGAVRRFVKVCLLLAAVLAASLGFYILSLPVLWKNPIGELVNTVKTFSDFTNWDDIFWYRGYPVRGNNLPRSYLFVWIFISTPVLYLGLFALGIAERFAAWVRALWAAVRGNRRTETFPGFWNHIFFGMVLVIPLCYVVLRKPTLYNGWRHFYFLYAVILIYAMYGAVFLWRAVTGLDERRKQTGPEGQSGEQSRESVAMGRAEKKQIWREMMKKYRWRAVCGVFLSACMALTFGWMVKNHPYEYVYFNPLVRKYALHNFELDYWAVSEADLFRYLCAYDDREEIRLWCTFSDYYKSLAMLPKEDQARLVYTDSPMEADYAVCRDLMKTSIEQMERQFAFEEVYSVTVDGRVINSLFRRTDAAVMKSVIIRKDGTLFCSGDGTVWKLAVESLGEASESVSDRSSGKAEANSGAAQDTQGMALLSDLGMEMELTKISVRHENQTFLEGVQFFVSTDGQNWRELSLAENHEDYILYGRKTVFQGAGPARHLKLTHREGLLPEDSSDLNLEIELFADRENQTELTVSPMIERVTGHENAVLSAQAADGNLMTRWQSEDVQRQGIAFDIVLDDIYSLSGIRLDTGESSNEYPRALRIFATKDEAEWTELPVETGDQMFFTFPETEVKALRLITGNMDAMDVRDRWSIYEISLMRRGE